MSRKKCLKAIFDKKRTIKYYRFQNIFHSFVLSQLIQYSHPLQGFNLRNGTGKIYLGIYDTKNFLSITLKLFLGHLLQMSGIMICCCLSRDYSGGLCQSVARLHETLVRLITLPGQHLNLPEGDVVSELTGAVPVESRGSSTGLP